MKRPDYAPIAAPPNPHDAEAREALREYAAQMGRNVSKPIEPERQAEIAAQAVEVIEREAEQQWQDVYEQNEAEQQVAIDPNAPWTPAEIAAALAGANERHNAAMNYDPREVEAKRAEQAERNEQS